MSNQEHMLRVAKRSPYGRYQSYCTYYQERYSYVDEVEEQQAEENRMKTENEFFRLTSAVGHVPMKKESKKLRQIMSKTGINAEDVRSIKLYRKELAETTKPESSVLSDNDKFFIKTCRNIMSRLKLPIWNPLVIAEIHAFPEQLRNNSWSWQNHDSVYFKSNSIPEIYMRLVKIKKAKK